MMKREPVLAVLKGSWADQCNAETIAILRSWIEKAERGEITSVAIAGVMPNGDVVTELSPTNQQVAFLGATALLHHRALDRAIGR